MNCLINNSNSGNSSNCNNNNIKKIKNKIICSIHKKKFEKAICIKCNIQVCIKCMISTHKGVEHDVQEENEEYSKTLLDELVNKLIPDIKREINRDTTIEGTSQELFSFCEENTRNNLYSVLNEFGYIKYNIEILENKLKSGSQVLLNSKKEIHSEICKTVKNRGNKEFEPTLNIVIEKLKNSGSGGTNNDYSEEDKQLFLKFHQELKIHSKNKLDETTYIQHVKKALGGYNEPPNMDELRYILTTITLMINSIDKYREIIISPKHLKYYNVTYQFCDASTTFDKSMKFIALAGNLIQSIPNQVTRVLFMPGFLDNLKLIENSNVKFISLEFYKGPLDKLSIPSQITELVFPEDYDQEFGSDLIPPSITYIQFNRLFTRIKPGDIPNTVICLGFDNGFNQKISPHIVHPFVKILYIANIEKDLDETSIPHTVRILYFFKGFKKRIRVGIIPHTIKELNLFEMVHELDVGIIPNGVEILFLHDGFNQSILNVIPRSVVELHIYDINHSLKIGSIPDSVVWLCLHDGFDQSLAPGIIPSSVKELHIFGIKSRLVKGSIPNGVETLYLHEGFHQIFGPGFIPESVKTIHLNDFQIQAINQSIPNGIIVKFLTNEFSRRFTPIGVIGKKLPRPSSTNGHVKTLTLKIEK